MKILSNNLIFGAYLKLFKLELEHKGVKFDREYLKTDNSVAVVVYNTVTQKYIFVKQFRVGSQDYLMELVAGHIEKNITAVETVKREVFEETGYETDTIDLLVPAYWTSPGFSTETIAIYYVEVSKKTGKGGGLKEENENIEVVEMTLNAVVHYPWIDGKTLIGLLKAKVL